jgi:amidohydrolase
MESSHNYLQLAQSIKDQLVEWRRDFHSHPELGFKENRTARALCECGMSVRQTVGRTGVVAEMGTGSPVVAIRADMDALPIQEANSVPYASQHPGVMHACGHDAHMAVALGTARILADTGFPGTLRFLFQPSEEAADDERGLWGSAYDCRWRYGGCPNHFGIARRFSQPAGEICSNQVSPQPE